MRWVFLLLGACTLDPNAVVARANLQMALTSLDAQASLIHVQIQDADGHIVVRTPDGGAERLNVYFTLPNGAAEVQAFSMAKDGRVLQCKRQKIEVNEHTTI